MPYNGGYGDDELGNQQYDPNSGTGNTGTTGYGEGGTPAPTPTPTPAPSGVRQNIAAAYQQYLGRAPQDYEYGFWEGNPNFAREIQNSPEARARSQGQTYTPTYNGFEGVDRNKLNNANVTTPKYVAARILAAGGNIQQAAMAVGGTVIDATRFRLPTGEIIDTRRDEEGANALQWLVLGNGANQGNNWTTPGTGGAGGTGTGGTGGTGGGVSGNGTVFSDAATAQWEQMIRELTDRLNNPTPAATLELQQTQALDPLERQRQQRLQEETLRLAQRGIGPQSGGIYDEAMANINRQFEETRTRTQAGFANQAAQTEEQRAMQAAQLFQQIPQYQDTRLQLAQGTMLNSNPYQALNLIQQYQQMQNQNSQYDSAQQQQFWSNLANLFANYFQG